MNDVSGEENLRSHSSVRVDIQALRGLAILLVLLHHAHLLPLLKAGYLGVDIFFVVSGYLITGIVQRSIEEGRFSFSQFYARRAKRLLPAAYATFLLTVVLSPFFLTSQAMHDFTWQLAGAVSFTGNIVLWTQTGYFEEAASLKPLLHVWSLSIEEQYYLLLPATLVFTPKRHWRIGAFFVFAISLALCAILVTSKPGATFYLLPTRAWELALGSFGVLALDRLGNRAWLKLAYWPALVVLVLTPFFPVGGPHPGLDAGMVCIATLIVILRQNTLFDQSLLMRAMSWLGDISYSLYLIHWPIMAFAANAWVSPVPGNIRLVLVMAAVISGWLMYRFIEQPTRHSEYKISKKLLALTAVTSLIVVFSGFAVNYIESVRNPADYGFARRANHGFSPKCEYGDKFESKPECRNSASPKILVWGDSNAMHIMDGIDATTNAGLEQATKTTCGPFLDVSVFRVDDFYNRNWAKQCIRFNRSVIDYLQATPSVEVVVLSSSYGQYLSGNRLLFARNGSDGQTMQIEELDGNNDAAINSLKSTILKVRAMGKRVVLVAPPPTSGFNMGRCHELKQSGKIVLGADSPQCAVSNVKYREARAPVLALLDIIQKELDVSVVRFDEFLCSEEICKADLNGTFLYADGGHLSHEGSRQLGIAMELSGRLLSEAR